MSTEFNPRPFPPDYHIHTRLCKHAVGEPEEYRERAVELNLPEICFTDHAPTPDGYDQKNRMRFEQFPEYLATIKALPGGETPEILFGVETDYYNGCERFLKDWLLRQPFDLVIGSVHYLDGWGFDNPEERNVWDSVDITNTWRAYFHLIGKLADSRMADVVAHLDLPKKFGHRPSDRDLKEMACPALDRIAAAGMVIEINTSGLRRPVKEIYPSALLLSLARERDIPVCFGSDAHSPGEVGWRFNSALEAAALAGYACAVRFRQREKTPYALPKPEVCPCTL